MSSIVNDQHIPRLTALERIGPKGYLRYIFPFQLQEEGVLRLQEQANGDIARIVVKDLPGERLPISVVQANFIRGGLILTWCIFHMVGDGTTFYTWTNIWAEECRRAQGLEIRDPIRLPAAIWQDRERVTKPSGDTTGKLESHPEYTLLPFTPPGAPPKMTSLSHRGQVFYFSPESLAALKAEASPVNATEPSDQK
ncbi:unnamed protein product [Penicillium palitans]